MDLPSTVAGYVPKNATPDVLTASITLVLAGGKCFQGQDYQRVSQSPFLASQYKADGTSLTIEKMDKSLFASNAESEMLGLTPRQYEVLVLLARGYPIKTIGRQLNISVATAKAHTETLYQRLDVHNRNQAVYAAVSRGATLGWHALPGSHDNLLSHPALLTSVA